MRILFSAPPDAGHTFPLLPLAAAARQAGHDVALLTDETMEQAVSPLEVLPVGPSFGGLRAETGRRFMAGSGSAPTGPPVMLNVTNGLTPEMLGELFVNVRMDLSGDQALAAARAFAPDLVIADELDALGPLVAADLGVAWVSHAFGLAPAANYRHVLDEMAAARMAARGLTPTGRSGYLDLWPDVLQPVHWSAPADRIVIRPQPYEHEATPRPPAVFADDQNRPRVLVTLGTTVNDPAAVNAIVSDLVDAGSNVIVTVGSQQQADDTDVDRTRVHPVGFQPLSQLLHRVDLVVSAAGAGTTLATLSRGIPAVLLPLVAEQPLNAERAAAAGAAAVVTAPQEVAPAAQHVLTEPAYRSAAKAVAHQIAEMNTPDRALRLLLHKISTDAR